MENSIEGIIMKIEIELSEEEYKKIKLIAKIRNQDIKEFIKENLIKTSLFYLREVHNLLSL